jgi:hypothetical protein
MSGPYAQTALRYWDAGWHGVLPLPLQDKYPPPKGFTGAGALMPSYADVYAWVEGNEGNGNIGLRFPPGLLGIDVDAYGEKMGGVTFAERLGRWGALPATWRLSSREDGLSGIYLYRVPEGLRWPGIVGPGIDIIENRYRYAVTWPSIHPSGNTYEWFAPNDDPFSNIPSPADAPFLTAEWVDALTHGQAVADIAKVELTDASLWEWLQSRPSGTPCSEMTHSVTRITQRLLEANFSRHDTMTTGVMHLAHLAGEGHPGIDVCLGIVRERFLSVATAGHDARSPDAAASEWHRALSGAAGVALADGLADVGAGDPCLSPLGSSVRAPDKISGLGRHADVGEGLTDAQSVEQGAALHPGDLAPSPPALDANHVESNSAVKSAPIDMTYLVMRVEEEIQRQDAREMARDIRDNRKVMRQWREPVGYNLRSAPTFDPITWAIEDVLPTNTNVVLTAQYKTGKTTLILNLARSLADGQKFLELYPVIPLTGNISLWNYEVGDGMFTRWARAQGIENDDRIDVLNLRGFSVKLRSPHARTWAIEYLRSRSTSIWVVDPFARAMSGDENSNQDVADFLDAFDEIKEAAGVAVGIVVTHTGRSEGASERSRGASRIDDWADVRWLLTSDDDRFRYFAATGRDVETVPGRLSFDPLTRRLSLTGEPKPVRVRQGKRNLADEIVSIVKITPGIGMRALIDIVQARGSAVTDVVRLLEQQNVVSVIRAGQGKSTSLYLAEAAKAFEAMT